MFAPLSVAHILNHGINAIYMYSDIRNYAHREKVRGCGRCINGSPSIDEH